MMKTHISIICLTATLALASCQDWLDVQPSTQTDRDELFSSEKGFGTALRGVYSDMGNPALYGRHLTWGLLDVFAGCYNTSWSAPFNAARQYAYCKTDGAYYDDELAGYVETYWTELYNVIAGVNSILGKIDEKKDVFSGDNYAVLKGEAIGLRAFLHFEILRLYGDIYARSGTERVMPYVNRLTSLVSPVLTGEQVIGKVISELETALQLLEKDPIYLGTAPPAILASAPDGDTYARTTHNISPWHNRRLRFNYYAAKATLARAYLWKGDKVKALEMARDVIAAQATRFPWVNTSSLGNIGNETSAGQDRTFASEHIFALNVYNLNDLIGGYHNTMVSAGSDYLTLNLNGLFTDEDRGVDPRKFRLVVSLNEGDFPSKYYQTERVYEFLKRRLPMIRISEMYYIAAECSPDWQDGLAYLQTVRVHRSIGAVSAGVTDAATLQKAITLECRREFMGEGQLWHYYKRLQFPAPNDDMYFFRGAYLYVFPCPDAETIYGNRN